MGPKSQVIVFQNKSEFFCPVCHVRRECEIHCVETWEDQHRLDHLARILEEKSNTELYPVLLEKFGKLEQCFQGSYLVTWEGLPPDDYMPLFSGHLVASAQKPQKWFSLYHQQGPALLAQYQAFILGQIHKPDQIQRILQVIRTHTSSTNQDDSTGQMSLLKVWPQKSPTTSLSWPVASSSTQTLEIEALSDAIEPDLLLGEILGNLI
ncbi:hypothetical protein WDW89_22395 [Deltaproteobacteria bacterium TL4]